MKRGCNNQRVFNPCLQFERLRLKPRATKNAPSPISAHCRRNAKRDLKVI